MRGRSISAKRWCRKLWTAKRYLLKSRKHLIVSEASWDWVQKLKPSVQSASRIWRNPHPCLVSGETRDPGVLAHANPCAIRSAYAERAEGAFAGLLVFATESRIWIRFASTNRGS